MKGNMLDESLSKMAELLKQRVQLSEFTAVDK